MNWLRTMMAALCLLAVAGSPAAGAGAGPRRVLVLGVDGMDHALTKRLMDGGRLPNLVALARQGAFAPLHTSIPPQSPVAWSHFTVGAGAGVHGIADFISRDPATMLPGFSMSRVVPPGNAVRIGPYALPLSSGRVDLLRRGEPFWDFLCEKQVPARIVRLPANFPPSAQCACVSCMAGMGTPDILGTYGTFTYFTSDPAVQPADVSGGVIRRLELRGDEALGRIPGPANDYRTPRTTTSVEFRVYRDPARPAVRLDVGGDTLVLGEGEWSAWIPVRFDLLGAAASVRGICRFYVQQVHPHLRLFVSPVNIDPLNPALPISTPAGMSRDMARAVGRFYTQGMPEDTKALSAGVLADEEYLGQARYVLAESRRLLYSELQRYDRGVMFFYFSTVDQVSHGLWRQFDPASPTYSASFETSHPRAIEKLYEEIDAVVGRARARLNRPDDVLIVMSDHGFCPFTREVELNQWLRKEGLLAVDPAARLRSAGLGDIDWKRTTAYNIGLNAVYINESGRERDGIVEPGKAEQVARSLAARLTAMRDPETGDSVVSRVWLTRDIYPGPQAALLPDLIVGFRPPYRISWKSALGEAVAGPVIKPNTDKWSGDHCVDPDFVPGVLFTSFGLKGGRAELPDLAPTLLDIYGIGKPAQMSGNSLLPAGLSTPGDRAR